MKNLFFTCFILISVSILANPVSGESGKATIDENFVIVLSSDSELAETYTADVSALKFQSAAEMDRFFAMFTENVVTYQVNHAEKILIIKLHSEIMPDWKLADWNNYFVNRAVKMQSVYESMFK